jgi:radical SAM protein with 4Fe4S-binding SPASM domain
MIISSFINPIIFKNKLTEITYFTTSACNYSCQHCFMIGQLNKKFDELSVSELNKMGKYIRSMQRVHLCGGEPFSRKDLGQIALTVANRWNSEVVCIPTNGWHTSNIVNLVESFGKQSKKMLRLHFSINKMGKEMDKFCGKIGAFDKWNKSIVNALDISKSFKNITIIGLVTFGDYNQSDFVEIKKYLLDEIHVDDFSFQLFRKNKHYSNIPDVNQFEYHVADYFQNDCIQNPFLIAYRELVRRYTAIYNKIQKQMTLCYAGRARIVMSPNGNIYPCETLGYPNGDNYDKWAMGNIRNYDYNIRNLLQSKKAKEIINQIEKQHCHCEHGIDIALNLLYSNIFKLKVIALGTKYLLNGYFTRRRYINK